MYLGLSYIHVVRLTFVKQDGILRLASAASWARLIFGIVDASNGWVAAAGSLTYATSFDSSAAKENTDSVEGDRHP